MLELPPQDPKLLAEFSGSFACTDLQPFVSVWAVLLAWAAPLALVLAVVAEELLDQAYIHAYPQIGAYSNLLKVSP